MSEVTLHSRDIPWHDTPWHGIVARLVAERLPHALLLRGPAGLGKSRLADRLAAALLCEARGAAGDACGRCRGCRLYASAAHPDLSTLRPQADNERETVGIEAVRALARFLALSSQYGGYRVALIEPADGLTLAAANSLLKTLEEPPANAVLILVSSRPARLPATVRSRCQSIAVAPPPPSMARRWLQRYAPDAEALLGMAGGAPLAAIDLAADEGEARFARLVDDLAALGNGTAAPVRVAAAWNGLGVKEVCWLLQLLLGDLARLRAAGRDAARTFDAQRLHAINGSLDSRELYDYLDRVNAIVRVCDQPLNEQLALEDLFVRWTRSNRQRKASSRG